MSASGTLSRSPRQALRACASCVLALAASPSFASARARTRSASASCGQSRRLAFASRVRLEYDADLDEHYPARYPSRVDITRHDGTTVSGVYLDAPGDPGTSFGPEELRTKWMRLLIPAVGSSAAEKVLLGLEDPHALLNATLAPVWEGR